MDGFAAFDLEKTQSFITDPSYATTTATRDLVTARFADVTTFIDAAKVDFDAAITALQGSGGAIPVDSIAASGISMPDWANLGISIPSFDKVFDATFESTKPTFSATLNAPGEKPSVSVAWQDMVFALDAKLVTAVSAWLDSGSPAIPAEVQAAIYNAALLRLNEAKTAARLEFEDKLSSRTFSAPPGVLDDALLRFDAEYTKAVSEVSAKIAERDMELTQANQHKAVDIAQAYVAAGWNFLVEKNKFLLSATQASVDMWIKEYDAAIKELEAHVKVFEAEALVYKTDGEVFETQGEVHKALATAYAATVEGLRAKAQYYIDQVRLAIDRYKADSEVDMKEAELKVVAKHYEYMLGEKISEAVAGVYAQTISSGFSGLHVSAGINASRSDGLNVGYNFGYSETLSESHSEAAQVISTKSTTTP